MTAWEVGTGQRPFVGLTMGQLIKKVFVKEERPSTADFEDGLKQLVESCWAPEPDDRPTFEEIKEVRPARERAPNGPKARKNECATHGGLPPSRFVGGASLGRRPCASMHANTNFRSRRNSRSSCHYHTASRCPAVFSSRRDPASLIRSFARRLKR